jgi:RNA polymerase sigma-70 factor (ECF subfamily)
MTPSRPSIDVQSVAATFPVSVGERALTFDAVYRDYLRKVLQWARASGCPQADLEDVAQEVFLVVRRRLDDFDGENVGGWLYRITQRMTRDQRRRAWFRRVIFGETNEVERPAQATDDVLDARLTFMRVTSEMNPERRTAFVLFEVDGYSGEEIAELEGVPVGTVWRRLHQARREFVEIAERQSKRKEARR